MPAVNLNLELTNHWKNTNFNDKLLDHFEKLSEKVLLGQLLNKQVEEGAIGDTRVAAVYPAATNTSRWRTVVVHCYLHFNSIVCSMQGVPGWCCTVCKGTRVPGYSMQGYQGTVCKGARVPGYSMQGCQGTGVQYARVPPGHQQWAFLKIYWGPQWGAFHQGLPPQICKTQRSKQTRPFRKKTWILSERRPPWRTNKWKDQW